MNATPITTLVNGDSQEELKNLESNSIDTIITDPPYGLSFMGKKWDYDVPSVELWTECLRVLKPGGTMLCFAGSRTQHRVAVNVEDAGFDIKDTIMWLYGSGFPKATDISKQLDKGNKGEVIGEKRFGKTSTGQGGGWNANAVAATGKQEVRALVSEEAKLWNGWKSHGLKPAYEPILVAVKPNSGTYANNALEWGVSGLNIDGGRIRTEESSRPYGGDNDVYGEYKMPRGTVTGQEVTGRFPANIILDEEAGDMLDEQSGMEASRFFYCAKASKAERNAGCEGLEEKQYSHDGRDKEIENAYQRNNSVSSNHHPTVKPLKLMEYLCTLTKTPTGGVVLDPFMGSGSTGVACNNTGRNFIGIELDKDYFEIAKARIKVPQSQSSLI